MLGAAAGSALGDQICKNVKAFKRQVVVRMLALREGC